MFRYYENTFKKSPVCEITFLDHRPFGPSTQAEVRARTEYHRPKTFIVQNKDNSLFYVLFTSLRFNLFTENQSATFQ
jgi:hypothetical protein